VCSWKDGQTQSRVVRVQTSAAGVREKRILPVFALNPWHEKLLDAIKPLLYCDPEFDRQIALPLS
jgi:hypothetical protein